MAAGQSRDIHKGETDDERAFFPIILAGWPQLTNDSRGKLKRKIALI